MDENTESQTGPVPFDVDTIQPRLQALIEGSGENWTYAIFWQSKSDSSLGWGDGYYHGEEEKKLRKKAASPNSREEQAHRIKVIRELYALIAGSDEDDGAAAVEEVTDTEWFFLVSMTQSFRFGSGLPGQALLSSRPIWVAGAQLAAYPCERARQSQVFGIRTIVTIPTAYGVVELGSTQFSTSSKFALLERVKQLMSGIDGLNVSSPSNSLFTMDEIQEFLRTPSPPPINQTNELNVGVWQGDGGECVAEDAALAHDRALFMLRGDKAPLNFPQLLEHIKTAEPTMAQQEKPDENSGLGNDEVETFGTGAEGTGEGEMVEGQSNSGCLGNGKRKGKTPRGERGNNTTTGVKIVIPWEAILQRKGMRLIDAAKKLNVSRSTLKRVCREYGIDRWPPRKKHKLINQSQPDEIPGVVDQERISQLNSDTLLPSNQISATVDKNSVTVKARYGKLTIKFQLSWPWEMMELERQVKQRLKLEAETYYINYKDEDNELILIACDEDLQNYISSSSLLVTNLIEVFLEPK
ncbi:transcription factor MYC1-like [Rhododendron vialii]|uniref:transcription factor MYC1-like n=1 Tax=Rhododendron vialii TaxID=182163 RepID=UPI00265DAE19|nr:transcription factor MYC1-like [Rhododendron vialii]